MGVFFIKDWRKRLRKKKAPFQERCFFLVARGRFELSTQGL